MSSKAVKENPDDIAPPPKWDTAGETAPSVILSRDPTVGRVVGFIGLLLLTMGAAILLAHALRRNPLFGPGLGVALFFLGAAGLLFHASGERDLQYRRAYGGLGFAWLVAGAIFTLVPVDGRVGALFLPYGLVSFALGLFFLLAFARNEDDAQWTDVTVRVLGVLGALLALVGFLGSLIGPGLLFFMFLPMLLLGLCFLVAFTGQKGAGSDGGYWTGVGIAGLGVLMVLVAVGWSVLQPRLAAWGWIGRNPVPFFVPTGLVLLAAGVVYALVGLGIFSDARLVVMTRRELAAYFYSPIVYIVFFGMTALSWYLFYYFVGSAVLPASGPPDPVRGERTLYEPIVASYLGNLFILVTVIFIVPVLTMRLLSEEKRTGTLEVLLTAPVPEHTVVLSKFIAAFTVYLLVWLPLGLFLVALRVEGGQPFDFRPMLSFYVALAFTGAAFVGMGLFFSALTRNQIAAAILTFVGMCLWTIPFFLVEFMLRPTEEEGGVWRGLLTYVSYVHLWLDSWSGTISPRQLVFFASACVVWLFLTIKVLEARKWS
jgi:ABC-type transport system involved in multi-copper enzyme maturation permease subunit